MAQRIPKSGPRITLSRYSETSNHYTPSIFMSWFPTFSSKFDYSQLPLNSPNPDTYRTISFSRRRITQACTFTLGIIAVGSYYLSSSNRVAEWDVSGKEEGGNGMIGEESVDVEMGYEYVDPLPPLEVPVGEDMWGWSEEMGWVQKEEVGLVDLGEIAEMRYRLLDEPGEEGTKSYFLRLWTFADTLPQPIKIPLQASLYTHLPPSLYDLLPAQTLSTPQKPPAMINYKTIHQTDKSKETLNWETEEWVKLNEKDGWRLNFLDDHDAREWMLRWFEGSDVQWAWEFMHRGVLRADFLRYMLPLVEGGVYSDVDTRPVRPIEQWGLLDVEYLNIAETDGPRWRAGLATHPAVMVAIDVDVHAKLDWWQGWPRAVDICQWTLSGAPYHPIYLDAVRRVVNSTRVVEAWEEERRLEIERVEEEGGEGWEYRVQELREQGRDHALEVMEWTGPGLFSDAVIGYLRARYNVSWHRLRGLNHPLRIGDVMILPISAFSPGGEPDFGAEDGSSPQTNVLHDFRGSWKPDGA